MVQVFGLIAMGAAVFTVLAEIVEGKAARQYREKLSWVTDTGKLVFLVALAGAVIAAFL